MNIGILGSKTFKNHNLIYDKIYQNYNLRLRDLNLNITPKFDYLKFLYSFQINVYYPEDRSTNSVYFRNIKLIDESDIVFIFDDLKNDENIYIYENLCKVRGKPYRKYIEGYA